MQHPDAGRDAAAWRVLMEELDEVLARIENQLNKMKKSLRSRNRELAQATISNSQTKKSEHNTRKNLQTPLDERSADPRSGANSRSQR